MQLLPHPRLQATASHLARLKTPPETPLLRRAQEQVERLAEEFAASISLKFNPEVHNALLRRAREMQTRVVTLLVRWLQTGDNRYRAAVMEHIREMGRWEHWCWEASLVPPDPSRSTNRLYDLSSGENSATLAFAYDWLGETVTDEERAVFAEQALNRCFLPFLKVLESQPAPPGEWRPGWWFKLSNSNWNTVCAGGAGLLALAMAEEFPSLAPTVLERVEESIRPYFAGLGDTGGGWVEGIGYWNYGHRYGFGYLLSHERATGRPHPFLALPGVRETLSFPLDFTPHGQFCSFPDVNIWWPLPFHYEAAVRLECPEVLRALTRSVQAFEAPISYWPDAAELLLFHPRPVEEEAGAAQTGVAKLYPGMDWAVLADRMPEPRLYMSIRGGSVKAPHSMVDALSFHVVVGREKLIDNLNNRGGDDYLETTFSARRNDIFEVGQPAKNVLFINGVGLPDDAKVETRAVQSGEVRGFRLDATRGFGFLGEGSPMADFCGRLFLMLHSRAFLIVDRFVLPHAGRVETRMHSFAGAAEAPERNGFLLKGERERLRVSYACNVDAVTATGVACLTKPVPGPTVLRWCTRGRTHRQIVMTTLLTVGEAPATVDVALDEAAARLRVEAASDDWRCRLAMPADLNGLVAG